MSGDLYIYPHFRAAVVCCNCPFEDGVRNNYLETKVEALEHVEEHKAAGHEFPYERVSERLQKEIMLS